MTRLPGISSRECIQALEKIGFYRKRQRGSHIIMHRDNPYSLVVVPQRRDIPRGTLRQIIKDAGLTVEEFLDLL